jgi:nucleoside-diphosphate-sugar epimerase
VGDHGEEWVDEDTPATPGARGRACLAGERLAAAAARRGVPALSLRLGWVYAASGFFARLVLPRAAKGKFTYMGNGRNFMPMVSRADAVEAYVRALEDPPTKAVLNVVDDEPLRMREIGELLLREFADGRPRGCCSAVRFAAVATSPAGLDTLLRQPFAGLTRTW